jgi:hypothetical protein
MCYIMSQSRYRGLVEHTVSTVPVPLLAGRLADAGLYAFVPRNGSTYTLSETLGYSLVVVGETLIQQPGTVNGRPWFQGSTLIIYYTYEYYWVLMGKTAYFPGYIPVEYYEVDTEMWIGDAFYAYNFIPTLSTQTTRTFAGRGTHKNSDPVPEQDISFSWPRWEKQEDITSPAGIYEAVPDSGATGTKTIGEGTWIDENTDILYRRSEEKDSTGNFTYGSLHYDSEAETWVIGAYGSADGWWEGTSEPSVDAVKTYHFRWPEWPDEGSVSGVAISLTFTEYNYAPTKETIYLTEAGVYR